MADLEEITQTLTELGDENARLSDENDRLDAENQALREKVEELEKESLGNISYRYVSLRLNEVERDTIAKTLELCNGRRKMAAEQLGISERTLYRKIKEYGLE